MFKQCHIADRRINDLNSGFKDAYVVSGKSLDPVSLVQMLVKPDLPDEHLRLAVKCDSDIIIYLRQVTVNTFQAQSYIKQWATIMNTAQTQILNQSCVWILLATIG